MIPVETVPGVRGGGNKREQWKGEFKCYIFDICKCHNVPPPSTTIKINK
jgi:hypothetical protein